MTDAVVERLTNLNQMVGRCLDSPKNLRWQSFQALELQLQSFLEYWARDKNPSPEYERFIRRWMELYYEMGSYSVESPAEVRERAWRDLYLPLAAGFRNDYLPEPAFEYLKKLCKTLRQATVERLLTLAKLPPPPTQSGSPKIARTGRERFAVYEGGKQ